MSCEKSVPPAQQAEELITQLGKTITHIDAVNLSGLAQMHGWCKALIELGKQDQAVFSENRVGCLIQLTCKLEELILGEAADAAAAFGRIVQQVQHLAASATGKPDTGGADAVSASAVGLTDKELNAKLAAIFADEAAAIENDMVLPPSGVFEPADAPAEHAPQAIPAQPEPKAADDVPKADMGEQAGK